MTNEDTTAPWETACYSTMAGVTCISFYFSIGYAMKYKTIVAFLLPPLTCVCIIYDNCVLASSHLYASGSGVVRRDDFAVQLMLVFHAWILPSVLLICYEVAYLVHKRRSVNFCGITFESGHRAHRKAFCSTFLRFSIWLLALVALVVNVLINFNLIDDDNPESRQSGAFRRQGLYELYHVSLTSYFLLSVIPAFVLFIVSLYIGLQLWNYGAEYSFMVHATYFNPWIWMSVGSGALALGNIMPKQVFALTSNAGEVVMMLCILRMFREIHHDLWQGTQMQNFISDDPTHEEQEFESRYFSSSSTLSINLNFKELQTPTKSNANSTPKPLIPVQLATLDEIELTTR